MKIILFLLFSLSTSLFAARSPAVEPVTGISIEEYTETAPQDGRGFDFNQAETFYEKSSTDTSLSMATIVFLVFASSLPFFVWFGVMRALPDATPVDTSTSSVRPSLSVVKPSTSEPSDKEDDQHWPKAS